MISEFQKTFHRSHVNKRDMKTMKKFLPIFVSVSLFFTVGTESSLEAASEKQTKSGFQQDATLGSPSSVGEQLREDDVAKGPAARFPKFDAFFKPWFDFKRNLNDQYGLKLGFDYNVLYQRASETLNGNEDQAASGAVRFYGSWNLVGRDTNNKGTLVFKVENRHRIGTGIAPAQLGFDTGYNGITGFLFSDAGSFLGDLNWQQLFNDGRGGLIIGRYDPNDYIDASGQTNPWTTFSNMSISNNTSIALPDFSYGLGAGHWISSEVGDWFVLGSVSDANGVADDLSFFDGGSEFFTAAEIGWTPNRSQRYSNHIHITGWHVDERKDVGVEESEGIAIGANWSVVEDWMVFGRVGWSDGTAPIVNTTATAGFMKRFHKRDLLGLGFNWGDSSNDALRDQYSTELFYRFQFAENLAITPSLQWLVDPANNPGEDQIWVAGLRMRLSL
jgi:porin